MWSGDPAFWGKTSPVLFPIVGSLKGDTFLYKDKKYGLSRHGFARECDFEISGKTDETVSFSLMSNPDTFKNYPFNFELILEYRLAESSLEVQYKVKNIGDETMFFSIGGHPAFKTPLTDETRYEDYFLLFNKKETAGRWPLSNDGLIEVSPDSFLDDENKLSLRKELFHKDAVVLKGLQSDVVSLRSDKHEHGLDFRFEGFPYLGIWAAKNADFVCIEPWCGIADSVNHNQKLEEKEGIQRIEAGEEWERSWQVRVY